ncbi:hypothetical protein CBL_06544 [Carabus blaptoides fortunei]
MEGRRLTLDIDNGDADAPIIVPLKWLAPYPCVRAHVPNFRCPVHTRTLLSYTGLTSSHEHHSTVPSVAHILCIETLSIKGKNLRDVLFSTDIRRTGVEFRPQPAVRPFYPNDARRVSGVVEFLNGNTTIDEATQEPSGNVGQLMTHVDVANASFELKKMPSDI